MKTMHNITYWYKNQVVITYYTQQTYKTRQEILTSVQNFQDSINQQLLHDTPYMLRLPDQRDMPARDQPADKESVSDTPGDLNGIYIFPGTVPPGVMKLPQDTLAVFHTIEVSQSDSTMHMNQHASHDTHGTMRQNGMSDHTLTVIDHLHKHMQIDDTDFSAMPHWFWTGMDDETHGCPVSPPIPVTDQHTSGQWKTQFVGLSDSSLEEKTGEGVTVFVLDTIPSLAQLTQARTAAEKNTLLGKMIAGMKSNPPFDAPAPAINIHYLTVPGPAQTAKTGKDIYGRLVGFPMADHGLAIAGIIRDLAPKAQIACLRTLNDYGVGDTDVLYRALGYIRARLNPTYGPGDLHGKPVVINLSLAVIPPMADWNRFGWDIHPEKLQRMLQGLAAFMESMAQDGAVFVASAGNDSDPRDFMMNPSEVRFGPRYPAAFLYDEASISTMIPVGAVNQQGRVSSYSNYPGPDGFGAYGGDLPRPDPWRPSAMSHINVRVDPSEQMDAIRGVYTDQYYPALSKNDRSEISASGSDYPVYPAPSGGWAYWAGTSFAVPIISALAARVLERQPYVPNELGEIDVRAAIRRAAQQMTWTGLENQEDAAGSMIMVSQQWIADTPSAQSNS